MGSSPTPFSGAADESIAAPAVSITAHEHSVAAGHIGVLNLHIGDTHPAFDVVPNSLPRRTTGFVDRAGDLARIGEVAARGIDGPPVCVIDGMPGVGKSALVVHAAHQLAGSYPDGQLFLDMRGYTPGQVPLTPIEALGLLLEALRVPTQRMSLSVEGRAVLWRSLVAAKRMLIVLDNVRSLEDISPLLPGMGSSLTLITSRHRFGGPETMTTIPLQTLPSSEAAQLFRRRAGLGDTVTELDVVDLVADCGHLPLAINLAAAWLRKHHSWSVDLAAAMRDGAQVPQLRGEDTHIAAAFELSYRSLGDAAQTLFRRLGLHPGQDITVDAAAALGEVSSTDARRLLEDLFDHHLVQEHRPTRYQLHDLVRRFARQLAERSDPEPQRVAAVRRLLDHYLQQARASGRFVPSACAEPQLDPGAAKPPPPETYSLTQRWFKLESANLIACARHSAVSATVPHAWAIPDAIAHLMRISGDPHVALDMYVAALECARDNGNKFGQARMLLNLAIVQLHQADYPATRVSLATSRELFQEAGDLRGEALTLTYLGAVHQQQGRYRDAAVALTEARQRFAELSDSYGQAEVLGHAGVVEMQLGDRESALDSLGRALRIFRQVGDRYQESKALTHLGAVHDRLTDDHRVALQSFHESLLIKRTIGDRYGEAWVNSDIGIAHRFAGDLDSALAHLTEAIRVHREVGDRQGEGKALVHLGAVQRLLGRLDESAALLGEALTLCQEIGNEREEASALVEIGALDLDQSRFDDARSHLDRAERICRDIEDVRGTVHALTVLGELSVATGNVVEARRRWEEAQAVCRDHDLPGSVTEGLRVRIAALPGD